MIPIIAEGFILGLSTGGYCLAACAPVFIPYLLADGGSSFKYVSFKILQFLSGRLMAYLLAALTGSLLANKIGAFSNPRISGAILIATSILLIIFSITKFFPESKFCVNSKILSLSKRSPVFFGFLAGFNLCPPFLVGIARIIDMGSLLKAFLFFISFFTATSLYMIPIAFFKPFLGTPRIKNIGRIASTLAGIYFLIIGLAKVYS